MILLDHFIPFAIDPDTSLPYDLSSSSGSVQYYYYTLQTGFLNLVSGYSSTIGGTPIEDIRYYDVSVGSGLSGWSIKARYEIVPQDCVYENVRICWLNRLGGYEYFNFSKEHTKSTNIVRKEFTKQLAHDYTKGDRQQTILSVDVNETYTANTDWLFDWEYNYLEELLTSPDVYILTETLYIASSPHTPGTVQKRPIIITDTAWKSKTQLKDRVYNLTIQYKYSHKPNIQFY